MLLIEIMFEGKLLLQTTFVSMRCFRTITGVPFPSVSVWQRVPCDSEGRERGGGGLTCRRGSTRALPVALSRPSLWLTTPLLSLEIAFAQLKELSQMASCQHAACHGHSQFSY